MKNTPSDDAFALAGRALIALLFLPAGLGKIAHLPAITAAIASKGLPAPALVTALVIALEILGSLALLAGWRVRWASFALAAFTLLAGVQFHDFWHADAATLMAQQQAFFKNIGLIGGLLVLASRGPGRFALDARRATPGGAST